MMIDTLHNQIAAVAPIVGVTIGNSSDKSTWIVNFDKSATKTQIAAAASIIAAFVFVNQPPISAFDFLSRFTAAEQTALWTALSTRPAILGQVMLWIAHGSVDLLAPETKAKLDLLVAAGIITAQREAVILAPASVLVPTVSTKK